jgi:hypothetical protein
LLQVFQYEASLEKYHSYPANDKTALNQ